MYDAAIIGGGPAGATAGRLLAAWGHSAAILTAPPTSRPRLAECLPPSTHKLFDHLGIRDAVERAGFLPTSGNTVWWGGKRRVESYPEGAGYQVPRGDFDALLLTLAEKAGARVRLGKVLRAVGGIEFESGGRRKRIPTKFILDCSGRAGVLGRAFRVKEPKSSTVALCGVWRNDAGWRLPDATHTLVEAYADGWAWSIPLSHTLRHVAFMVDPGETKMVRGAGLLAAYLAELGKTRAFRRIFSRGTLEQAPWGRDASLYTARRYAGPGLLIAGDAGAFIDPLSSFGVKKAMVSAWVAAVVVNTCLVRPEMQEAALQFFNDRETQVYADYHRRTASWFRAAGRDSHAFWTHRSEFPDSEIRDDYREATGLAFESLKRKRSIRLRLSDHIRIDRRPAIEGQLIVLRSVLTVPNSPEPFDFFENVDLARLAQLAGQYRQVPDLFTAYNRAAAPVPLPNFLSALSLLLARGILIDQD